MRLAKVSLVGLLLSTLAGCVTPPLPFESDFLGVEAPQKGFARVYVLRPAFDTVSKSESPRAQLDGSEIFRLQYGSYMPFQLQHGTHRLSLRPEATESKLWFADYNFSVEPDRIYFLAIWNDVEYRSSNEFVPVMGKVPFVVPIPQTVARNRALRIEFVEEEDAVLVLNMSRRADRVTLSDR